MSTNEILQYLTVVIDIEKNIHTQKNVITELENYKSNLLTELQQNIETEECMSVSQKYGSAKNNKYPLLPFLLIPIIPFYMIFMPIIASISLLIRDTSGNDSAGNAAMIIGFIVYVVLSLVIVLGIKKRLDKKKAAENLNNDSIRSITIKARNSEITQMIPRIDNELANMKQTLAISQQALDKVYSNNIIPQKYRSLIPVCMFYEYIQNGRTHTITENPSMHEECAINIYERELFMQLIIGKLDAISAGLDELSENQKILYNTVVESSRTTHKLLSDIGNKLDTIEYQNLQRKNCSYYINIYS